MSKLPWYWHRLRAMEPAEIAANLRRKLFQWSDEQELPDWSSATLRTDERPAFPRLPPADSAPLVLRQALQRDLRDILAGRWRAFGHLQIDVDDPPRWHKDYHAGQDLATDEFAFKLNHRRLPEGADIKLIWELSRWYQLVRLAMAAYVLKDRPAARKCVAWLADWAAPLDRLQKLWEREVLAQFAGDGGNREQALNYHLFSWEFCRQAQAALRETGRGISTEVEERVRRAEDFFLNMQMETDAWD